jgi:glyoxylase-like metal-dependent hydrolase (beta-lactamase superfamily II)
MRYTFISVLLISFMLGSAYCQSNTYEVYALKFGSRDNKVPVAATAVGSDSKDSVEVCFMIWLLKGNNGRMVLVDAGFDEDADATNITFVRPDLMLAKMRIQPTDITDIIITHPHWDHIGGIDLFPNAMLWMQKEDYRYFVGDAWQNNGIAGGFNPKDVQKIVRKNVDHKLTLVNGDDIEIIPGIKVFVGSKHTYESQYVLVNTSTDKVIIASDNSWFYHNLIHLWSIPMTFDTKAYIKSLKRMKKMVKNVDLIIPGHDPLVFSKFHEVTKDIVRIQN